MIVRRGFRDDNDDELTPLGGHADALLYSDDMTLETHEELQTWKQELREIEARKIVPGFYVGLQKKYPAREESDVLDN